MRTALMCAQRSRPADRRSIAQARAHVSHHACACRALVKISAMRVACSQLVDFDECITAGEAWWCSWEDAGGPQQASPQASQGGDLTKPPILYNGCISSYIASSGPDEGCHVTAQPLDTCFCTPCINTLCHLHSTPMPSPIRRPAQQAPAAWRCQMQTGHLSCCGPPHPSSALAPAWSRLWSAAVRATRHPVMRCSCRRRRRAAQAVGAMMIKMGSRERAAPACGARAAACLAGMHRWWRHPGDWLSSRRRWEPGGRGKGGVERGCGALRGSGGSARLAKRPAPTYASARAASMLLLPGSPVKPAPRQQVFALV